MPAGYTQPKALRTASALPRVRKHLNNDFAATSPKKEFAPTGTKRSTNEAYIKALQKQIDEEKRMRVSAEDLYLSRQKKKNYNA